MAVGASVLRDERRRHLMVNFGLVASLVVGGMVVTNERGLFVPLGIHDMSETAKAFAAMFTPSRLLPSINNVQMVAPLEPFDVTADSRDLRRRLMDAYSGFSGPGNNAADQTNDLAQFDNNALTPTEYAQNSDTGTPPGSGANSGGGSPPGGSPFNRGPGDTGGPGPEQQPQDVTNNQAPVPEPSMWAMLVAGFGSVGYMLRAARRRRAEAQTNPA